MRIAILFNCKFIPPPPCEFSPLVIIFFCLLNIFEKNLANFPLAFNSLNLLCPFAHWKRGSESTKFSSLILGEASLVMSKSWPWTHRWFPIGQALSNCYDSGYPHQDSRGQYYGNVLNYCHIPPLVYLMSFQTYLESVPLLLPGLNHGYHLLSYCQRAWEISLTPQFSRDSWFCFFNKML